MGLKVVSCSFYVKFLWERAIFRKDTTDGEKKKSTENMEQIAEKGICVRGGKKRSKEWTDSGGVCLCTALLLQTPLVKGESSVWRIWHSVFPLTFLLHISWREHSSSSLFTILLVYFLAIVMMCSLLLQKKNLASFTTTHHHRLLGIKIICWIELGLELNHQALQPNTSRRGCVCLCVDVP